MQENNVIVTDAGSGVVQFYADGQSVVDRLNTVMPNGGDLAGGPSNMYGTSIIFDPSGCNRYYLFYGQSEVDPSPRAAYYSVLDLDLPGNGTLVDPLGDIDTAQKKHFFPARWFRCYGGILCHPQKLETHPSPNARAAEPQKQAFFPRT